MYKNAIEKINKFYEINLNQNSYADEIFQILSEIIPIESAAIFYLTPESLKFEAGSNFRQCQDVRIDKNLSTQIYNKDKKIKKQIKSLFHIKSDILVERLIVKEAVYGILLITGENTFSINEKIIFKTCSSIISNLIKDLELSKVLKMQIEALQTGIIESNRTYNSIKQQNKKIKENEKLQNEFISHISHELRTPLNSIIGFSDILSQKLLGELNKKQIEYVDDIKISGLKLLEMINEVLDISKIESHTVKLNYSEIDFVLLANEVCNILKPLIHKKNIHLKEDIEYNLIFKGDYLKIQQVLFNILGNAIKFSPNNSTILISAYIFNKEVIIRIKDNGIGIDKKYHKKIFNKFFQVHKSMPKAEPSTGFGLTIAKKFIQLHNGEIYVESEPDKGTEFVIKIPYCI